jgi:subtilase-type proteinase RRT12
MSFATLRNNIFNRALQNVISMDIPVVAAAGNQNTTACLYSPASAEDVLVVGSFDDREDTLAEFINWGRCVDAFAPGVDVDSLDAHAAIPRRGGANTRNGRLAPAVSFSGTSVSSAIGSGLVAYFMGMGDSGLQAVDRVSIQAEKSFNF